MTRYNITQNKLIFLLIVVISIIFILLYSIQLTQDMNWDLLNYHYYNGYAYLNNRVGFDILPSGIQTGHHPLMDIFFYLIIKYTSPITVAIIITLIQLLNLLIIYKLIKLVINYFQYDLNKYIVLLISLISFFGAGMIGGLGGTMGDTIVSIPILLIIYLEAKAIVQRKDINLKQIILIGSLSALSISLKLTTLIFIPSILLGFFFIKDDSRRKIKYIAIFLISLFTTFLILQGYWMFKMIEVYKSPLFPYFNSIFHSPFLDDTSFFDTRFLPKTWWKALLYPLLIVIRPLYVSENYFREIRFGILYLLLFLILIYTLIRGRFKQFFKFSNLESFLFLFFIISFIIWEVTSSIYRYLIPLELLAPLLILILLKRSSLLFGKYRMYKVIKYFAVIIFISIPLLMKPQLFFRVNWQNGDYFNMEISNVVDIKDSTILLSSGQPYSYIIPYFDPSNRFIKAGKLGDALILHDYHKNLVSDIINSSDLIYVLIVDGNGKDEIDDLLLEYDLKRLDYPLYFTSITNEYSLYKADKLPQDR